MTAGEPRLFAAVQERLTTDDYYTPAWVFEWMGLTFDLDVCAPVGGLDWVPAARSLSVVDDGLTAEWMGRVWMNPPYSNPERWVDRFIDHGHGVALVPVTNGAWFTRLWACVPAVTILPRLVFVNGDRRGNPYRIAAAAFGPECVEAIGRLGTVRVTS
jgi:hypothetical protein